MILRMPACCDSFRCTADRCTDSCCAGWDVVIDRASLDRYDRVRGPFGQALREGIVREGGEARFRMGPDGRCAFLNRDGLCEVYRHLGPEALCQICADHPRFFNVYGPVQEMGLGLCCEEAARLWFAQALPFRLLERREGPEGDEAPVWLAPLEQVRAAAFALLQDARQTVPRRLALVVALCGHAQVCVDRDRPGDVRAVREAYARPGAMLEQLAAAAPPPEGREALGEIFGGLEALDPAWTERLARRKPAERWDPQAGPFLERMGLYLVYRYLLRACRDGDVLGRGKFAAASCLVLLDLCRDAEDPVALAKDWSKNVEYCPANLDRLAAAMDRLPAAQLLGWLLAL